MCPKYEGWHTKSDLLTIDECYHYIPVSGRCDCQDCQHYNEPCPWAGQPEGEDE